jgi:DNA-directed RNA polymerase specialized sigma24 family protein
MPVSDSELLYMIHQRNEFAYKQLFNKYVSISKTWIFKKYQKSRSFKTVTDDLLSIALASIHEAICKYVDSLGPFYPFCRLIVLNRTMTFMTNSYLTKQSYSLEQGILKEDEVYYFQIEDETLINQPSESARIDQLIDMYINDTATTNKNEDTIAKMRLDGYTIDEISKMLNISPSMIKHIILQKKLSIIRKLKKE